MWILTQNGERILSTDSLDEITVSDPVPGKTDYVIMMKRRIDGKGFALGFYMKRERAKSVLREIIKEQAQWMKVEGAPDSKTRAYYPSYAVIPPKTFMMPAGE